MATRNTVYLTNEQIVRLCGLSADAVIGIQITTDESDQSPVNVDTVAYDDIHNSRHYVIDADGTMRDVT